MSQMLQDPQGPPAGDPGQGLPPELVAAIQGAGQGGPPPGGQDPGQGLPPELMAMLQGGGAPQDGGPTNPASGGGKPGIDDPSFKILVQKLAQIAAQEPDAQDAAMLLKLVGELKKLIGGRQDEGIQAMGGNPAQMRGLSRAYGG